MTKQKRRLAILSIAFLLLSALAFPQTGFNSFQKTIFNTVNTASPIHQSSIINYHQLQWTVTGTVSSCTVAIDESTDGVAWTAGGILTGQTCTTAGQSAVTNGSANYVRVNLTAFAGTSSPTVTVSYLGWINNPAGVGNGTVTNVGNITGFATSANSTTSVTWNIVAAAANTVWGRCTASLGAPSYCSITAAMLPDLSATYAKKNTGSPADGCATWVSGLLDTTGTACGGGTGTGTVTSVGTTDPPGLFTSNVATPTAAAQISFNLSQAAGNTVWGNCSVSLGAPSYCPLTAAMIPNLSSTYQPLLGFTPENVANRGTAYASLTGGIVPRAQLGSGVADGTTCNFGDGTWKTCGSTAAPTGTVGQIVQLNGTGQFQVIPGLYWDANTNTLRVPGILDILGSWEINSDIPTNAMTVAAASQSKIGFDNDGKLKVSENSGAVTEIAKTNSNITGNAATATAVAGTPTTAQYYGTNPTGGGTTKGFYDLPTAGTGDIKSAPTLDQSITQPAGTDLTIPRQNTRRECVGSLAGLQACHDDLPAGGGTMIVPAGTITGGTVTISKNNVHIRGGGIDTTVISSTTAGTPNIRWTGTGGSIEKLTIQKATNEPTCAGGAGSTTCGEDIQFVGSDRFTMKDVKLKNGYHGYYLDGCSLCTLDNVIVERNKLDGGYEHTVGTTMQAHRTQVAYLQNGGAGLHIINDVNSNVSTCGDIQSSRFYGNQSNGLRIEATGTGASIADCQIEDNVFSTNNDDNVYLDNAGRKAILFGNFYEQAGAVEFTGVVYGTTITPTTGTASGVGSGVEITANCDPTTPPSVSGGHAWNNSDAGVTATCIGTTISNVSTHGNGRGANASNFRRAGITIRADRVSVIGGEHDGDTGCSGTACEKYGIEVSNSADTPSITGYTCATTLTSCVQLTTQPTNGLTINEGGVRRIYDTGAPVGSCSNAEEYHRTDAGNFDTVFGCKNAAWVAMTAAAASGTVTNTGGSLTNDQLIFGAGTNDIKVGNLTGEVTTSGGTATTIGAGVITAAKSAGVLIRRVCAMAFGDTSGSALTDAQLGPQKRLCFIPAASTIVEVDVAADGGTPNIIVGRNRAGTGANIVSAALATAASGGIACSKTTAVTGLDGATTCSATLQNTDLNAGDYLEAVSGTAGGTAKLMTVFVTYTVN